MSFIEDLDIRPASRVHRVPGEHFLHPLLLRPCQAYLGIINHLVERANTLVNKLENSEPTRCLQVQFGRWRGPTGCNKASLQLQLYPQPYKKPKLPCLSLTHCPAQNGSSGTMQPITSNKPTKPGPRVTLTTGATDKLLATLDCALAAMYEKLFLMYLIILLLIVSPTHFAPAC